ncbi:MAG: SHOCT domain-containing protein [Anaerolineae bacterium]
MFIIPLVVIGGLVWWLWGSSQGRRPYYGGQEPTPLEILEQRYARGEITREQFLAMREDLSKHA